MQRFFSTFPNAWPGAGLFVLRLMLGGVLIADAATALVPSTSWQVMIPAAVELLTAAFIIVGLGTPIVATLVCLLQLGSLLMFDREFEPHLIRAAVSLSLALLGPGAWSIDARLFGRRRVEIKHLRDG